MVREAVEQVRAAAVDHLARLTNREKAYDRPLVVVAALDVAVVAVAFDMI